MMLKRIHVLFLVVLILMFFVPPVFAASAASQSPKPYRPQNLDVKASDFAIQIYVTSPGAGTKWRVDTKKAILWTANPAKEGPLVKVLLVRKDQVQTVDGQQAQLVIKDN